MKNIIAWIRLKEFHMGRSEFYQDWIKSIKRGETLPNFLSAELAISRSKQTINKPRAHALSTMLRRHLETDTLKPSEIVGLSMPAGDRLLLASVDDAKDENRLSVLEDLVEALAIQTAAKNVLLRAVAVPAIVLPGIGVFAYILSSQLIPVVENIAPPSVWTPFNETVRVVCNFINHGGVFVLIAIVAMLAWLIYALPNWTSRTRFKFEKYDPSITVWMAPIAPWLMPFSIYRDFQALMVLSTLAVLLRQGRTLKEGLDLIAKNGTPYVSFHARRILAYTVEQPLEVPAAFTTGILSPRIAARLASIARTNTSFEKVLIEVGTIGNVEIRKQLEKTSKKLNFVFVSMAIALAMFLYVGQVTITTTMKKEMDPAAAMMRDANNR